MNKDVIYIDVEDDITAIVGKIKASSEKIVALVPPKRIGVLQSAVNLRLLQRMATNAGKRMVLITNNQSLIALSAVASIPVAKNLQTKPEIAEIPALSVDDGEDIIDGSSLPIGELAKTADSGSAAALAGGVALDSMDIESDKSKPKALGAKAKDFRSGIKVPNFNTFRKKMFIGLGVLAVLIGFLAWAIMYAPAAKVIITARTTAAAVNTTATLGGTAATDVVKGLIQSSVQQTKRDIGIDFTATGTKDVGDKATGSISVENCDSNSPFNIAANTVFVSSTGKKYINPNQATVPGFTGSASVCRTTGTGAGMATVPVVAQSSGEASNAAAANYTITGISGDVYAHGGAMAGGTTKIATIVTADDVQKASAALVEQSSDQVKAALIKQFSSTDVVIDDSFTIDRAAATSSPAIGAEATGTAKLTSTTTYTISAIAKTDLELYLKANLEKQIVGKTNQRVYDDGVNKTVLSGYSKTGDVSTVKIVSTGQIGPKIDEAATKEQIKGMIFGDVQATISKIDGVDGVDTVFSYFWVRTVPNDINKITIEFKLQNG